MPARNFMNKVLKLDRDSFSHRLFKIVFTFMLINFSWIFFRADRFLDGIKIVKSIITTHNLWILFDNSLFALGLDWKNFMVLIASILILLTGDAFKYKGIRLGKELLKQELWFRWFVYIFSIVGILIFGIWGMGYDASSFIYFQF